MWKRFQSLVLCEKFFIDIIEMPSWESHADWKEVCHHLKCDVDSDVIRHVSAVQNLEYAYYYDSKTNTILSHGLNHDSIWLDVLILLY